MSVTSFQEIAIKRISPEAAGAVAITFDIPKRSRQQFSFEPGQYLTLRAQIDGTDVRRSYSISSARSHLSKYGEIEIGIRPVAGGVFSNWASTQLREGDKINVMPPEGRFCVKKQNALHRVGFAAGSGITPILSIVASTLEEQAHSKFTLIYGNRRTSSVMYNEALQDLKDKYPDRFTMIHILSQQSQEVDLMQGRIDSDKVKTIIAKLLPVKSMDEVFICGPQAMIEAVENTLIECGVPSHRVHSERFTSANAQAIKTQLNTVSKAMEISSDKNIHLSLVLDGKQHEIKMSRDEYVLDAAINAGLDLPFSCKAGVCSTCRCKVFAGEVAMDKNYTLETDEISMGYVLSCQSRAMSDKLTISFDHR